MKGYLLGALALLMLAAPVEVKSFDSNLLSVPAVLTQRVGLAKAVAFVASVAAYVRYGAASAERDFLHKFSVGLLGREAVLAATNCQWLGDQVAKLPEVGGYVRNLVFGGSDEEKAMLANLVGVVTFAAPPKHVSLPVLSA